MIKDIRYFKGKLLTIKDALELLLQEMEEASPKPPAEGGTSKRENKKVERVLSFSHNT